MKFLTATFLTALLAFISGLFLPWWGMAITSLLVAVLIHQKAGKAFLAGLLGVFLLWAGLAWWIDMKNNGVLSTKIRRQFIGADSSNRSYWRFGGRVGGLEWQFPPFHQQMMFILSQQD